METGSKQANSLLETKYLTLINLIEHSRSANINKAKLCFELLSVSSLIDKICAEKLAPHKLSESRFLILALLNQQPLSPQKLTELSGLTKSTITQLINTLYKDNYIHKTGSSHDKRKYLISLTAEGKCVIDKVFEEHTLWIENITYELQEQDIIHLQNILGKISHHLKSTLTKTKKEQSS